MLTYWQQRAVRRVLAAQKQEDAALREIRKATLSALKKVQEATDRMWANFEKKYKLDPADAKELLASPAGREEYELLMSKIAQMPRGAERLQMEARAASGAYSYRMSQQEALKAQIEAQSIILAGKTEQALKAVLETVGAAESVAVREELATVGVATSGDTMTLVREIMRNPWNGSNYSSRIWKNAQQLKTVLDETITGGVMAGRSHRVMAAEISEKMSVSYYQADRLVRTEVNRLQNTVALNELKDAGIDKYEWVARLDGRTCKLCGPMDGQTFSVDDAVTGKTLPPKHPFCRCVIVRYSEPDTERTRYAKVGDGIKVPADMKYTEWAEWVDAGTPDLATWRKNRQ
jgi:SPP1 gp7 family putative phage head morphogenesis protein